MDACSAVTAASPSDAVVGVEDGYAQRLRTHKRRAPMGHRV